MENDINSTERRLDYTNKHKHKRRKEDKENITCYYLILGLISSILTSIGVVSFIYSFNL